jgi:hypothetical protein
MGMLKTPNSAALCSVKLRFGTVAHCRGNSGFRWPRPEPWNGQPALLQGRIWASFETEDKAFEKWYNATVRWIRKNFIRDVALGHDRDSVGPEAYEWFKSGGLLLPSFRPPTTDAWLAWVDVQNQHRADLSNK